MVITTQNPNSTNFFVSSYGTYNRDIQTVLIIQSVLIIETWEYVLHSYTTYLIFSIVLYVYTLIACTYRGSPHSTDFGGKEIAVLCETVLCGDYFSTKLLVKSEKQGKLFFKVHFLSIFSDLQVCMTYQINLFYTVIQIFHKIIDFFIKILEKIHQMFTYILLTMQSFDRHSGQFLALI